MKHRIIAIARLLIALVFVWASLANAAGIDPLAIIEVIRYALSHPEALAASAAIGWAWWKDENITERAIRDAERNKVLDDVPDDFCEDEGDSNDNA